MSKLKTLLGTSTEKEALLVAEDIATDIAVDPTNIPKSMTRDQLQWWILFTIAVAGKTAKTIEKKMRQFLNWNHRSPFAIVQMYIQDGKLGQELRRVKLGKYTLLNRGFRKAITLDLDSLEKAEPIQALSQLSTIPGLGPKGSRMILMYAFPHHADLWVPLDTHILRWLRERGYDAPKSTPTGKKYLELETAFRQEAKKRRVTMRELDTRIWNTYSKASGDPAQGF